MFAIAARRLGYQVHVYSPDDDTPTGQVADVELRGAYDDLDAVADFARKVSVVTFEFENVPAATAAACERFAPVRPGGNVLHVTQNRLREKSFVRNAGLPVTPFKPITSRDALQQGLAEFGGAGVLKTAASGYDGKGQAALRSAADVERHWPAFANCETVLEKFIDFECEVSVVAARDVAGRLVTYGPIHNTHARHILDVSVCPAPVSEQVARDAVEIAREIMTRLEVVGVLCVEFFVTAGGGLMVNELAPRPHNSGHFTIDACTTCQFEQQVRAVCGLPLGSPRQHRPAAMANLLGDIWQPGPPRWDQLLGMDDVKLHLYGKSEPRVGRKMGHLTALADTADRAVERVRRARNILASGRREPADEVAGERP
jgi:5-(carboxyamino)imidazole ribonucleotide synthase